MIFGQVDSTIWRPPFSSCDVFPHVGNFLSIENLPPQHETNPYLLQTQINILLKPTILFLNLNYLSKMFFETQNHPPPFFLITTFYWQLHATKPMFIAFIHNKQQHFTMTATSHFYPQQHSTITPLSLISMINPHQTTIVCCYPYL